MNCTQYSKNEDQVRKAISSSFINLRKKNNLTQEKLAEILDVSIEHISRIENCRYTCSITLIFKMCSIFNITLDDFFSIKNNDDENNLQNFIKDLSLEKRNAIYQFCKEVENSLI